MQCTMGLSNPSKGQLKVTLPGDEHITLMKRTILQQWTRPKAMRGQSRNPERLLDSHALREQHRYLTQFMLTSLYNEWDRSQVEAQEVHTPECGVRNIELFQLME